MGGVKTTKQLIPDFGDPACTRGTRYSLSSTRWRENHAFVPYFDVINLHGVEEKSWLAGYVFHNKQLHQ